MHKEVRQEMALDRMFFSYIMLHLITALHFVLHICHIRQLFSDLSAWYRNMMLTLCLMAIIYSHEKNKVINLHNGSFLHSFTTWCLFFNITSMPTPETYVIYI